MNKKLLLNTFFRKANRVVFAVLLFICFSTGLQGYSQTTIIDPTTNGGFESGTTFAANGWTSNTPGSATNNQWVCSTGATAGFSGTRAAYVTNNRAATPPPHAYTDNPARVSHLYRNVTIPIGEDLITLDFDWIADAENWYDRMRVWIVPTGFTPTFGTQIGATGTAPTGRVQINGNFSEQYTWTNSSYMLPAAYAGTTVRLVFEWRNDGSVSNLPPAAIDNISLISDAIVPPANDDPCSAVSLTVNPDYSCSSTAPGTVLFATNSGVNSCGGTEDDDVWYSFIATGPTHTVDLINVAGSTTDLYHAVYGGFIAPDCSIGIWDNVNCSDPNSSTLTGLTTGQTYFVQVYTWTATSGQTTTFDICIGTPPPPPVNDDPCGAISLTVNPDYSCTNITSGTITSATDSGINACGGTEDDDVWFSFVATGPSHTVDLINVAGSTTDMYHAVYGGFIAPDCSVATGDNISCSDPNSSVLTGLTTGRTYFVQVYTWTATAGQTSTFDICIGTPPPPPPNDECSGAIGLTVNTDRNCGVTTAGTTVSATASPQTDDVVGTPDNDVWYSFVATNTSHSVSLLNITFVEGSTDMAIGVYNGSSGCASLVFEDDSDPNTLNLTGLNIGDLYYVRIYGYYADPTDQANFDVCIGTPPPPPPNDEPCTAIALTSDLSCNETSGYIEQATNSGIDACFGTPNDDVWYSFVAIDTIHYIDLTNISGSTTDLYHAVYGGFIAPDCSVAVGDNISCSDADSSSLSGLTIGETYFIQVFSYSSSSGATTAFDICVTEPPPPCVIGLTPLTTPSCPFVDVTPDTSTVSSSCGGVGSGSETLTADFLDLGDTSDYDVDLITYNTTTFNNFDSAATNTVALSADDRWSDVAYNIPFNFCYYGATVNQFVVGANAMVSFNTAFANTASGYSYNDNLPSTNGALFDNTIYASYHDIDPGVGGTIRYGSTSVSGCNALVIIWDDIPMFSDNSRFSTSMLVMYEDTNTIEVYIKEKVIDGGDPWNNGNAIVGIQNSGATEAVVAPCRNGLDQNWTTTNEAWRFTPSGGASIANLQWLVNGTLNATYNGQTSITVSPVATTTYTAQVTYTLCDASTLVITDATTVVVSGGKVWDGSESSDWMDPDNWSDGAIPTATDCVIIPATANDPILYDNDNGDGLYMVIETGATLTLTSDTDNNNFASSLTIQDVIDIQGTGTLIVEDDASLIQVYDSSTGTLPSGPNTGDIELYRNTEIRLLDYVYWSSPVQGFDVSDIYGAFTPTGRIYSWTPTIPTGTFNTGVPVCYGNWNPLGSGAMDLGKGYIVRGPTNHSTGISTATALFTGVPNNGVITQPISSGNNSFGNSNYTYNPYGVDNILVTPFDDNWNLLGNPYPSALDAQSFLTHPSNSIIEGAVHVWTHGIALGNNGDSFYDDFALTYSVNDYITYNFSGTNTYAFETFGGKIGSGQGFFVLALNDNESGNVTFNNSMRNRTHSNTEFYRTASSNENASDSNGIERHRIWLNLINQNESVSSILVGYIEGATQEKDRLFDAYIREVNDISMYSKIGDERMIIQGRALPFDNNDQVPLGTVIPQAGQYTIAISNVDGLFLNDNQPIYLEDTHAGIIHNLRTAPYSFTETERSDYGDRFILRYTNEALSVKDLNLNTGLTIIAPKGDYIKVSSQQSLIESVIIYDILGRVLFNNNAINETEFIINNNLSDGTYIVKATLANGHTKTQKIVLKTRNK